MLHSFCSCFFLHFYTQIRIFLKSSSAICELCNFSTSLKILIRCVYLLNVSCLHYHKSFKHDFTLITPYLLCHVSHLDRQQFSKGPSFTLQRRMTEEQAHVHEGAEIKEAEPKVKEEQLDVCVSPDMEVDSPVKTEVWLSKAEPTSDGEESLSSPEDDGSTLPNQSASIEVVVDPDESVIDDKQCRFCRRHFKKQSMLMKHIKRNHKGKKAFECPECNKEFRQRYNLANHMRVHTGEKAFKCDFCDRTFAQSSSCYVHMRVHTGEKPYFCKNCGRSFATSSHLKQCKLLGKPKSVAKKATTEENVPEEKLLSCFACPKKFRYKYQLDTHVRMHTGERPYSCEVCGKTFTQSSGRNVHMKVHTGERPYFCKKCGKSFRSKDHLETCRKTRKEKSFRCEKCGKAFYTELELEVHLDVHEAWKTHMSKKLQNT